MVMDRRNDDRLSVQPCKHCNSDEHLAAVSRTPYAVYFRCSGCAETFSMPKPHNGLISV